MSFWKAIKQDIIVSAGNSSVVNLAKSPDSGYIFAGVAESTLGVAAIQISLKADQNCTVTVEQSPDNAPAAGAPHWDIIDTYNYRTTVPFGITVQAVNSYVRVTVTNLNTLTATTFFRLQTVLCPIVEAVPRSLSEEGNLKVGVYEIEDEQGNKVGISPMGEIRTTDHVRLVGANFAGTTFDTNFWTKTTQAGTGDATLAAETLTLLTGATANSSIIVNSVRSGRYVGGCSNYYRGVVRVPAVLLPSGSNLKRWGAFNAADGFYFETDGTTLTVCCRNAGNDTNRVSSGNFTGRLGRTYLLDANSHTYEIYWTNSSAWFFIDGNLLHKFSGSTATLTANLNLQVGMQNTNAGGNTGLNTLEIRTATINRLGVPNTRPLWKNQAGAATAVVLKQGAGTLKSVIWNKMANGATLTLYDAVTATNPIASFAPANGYLPPASLNFDIDFYTGHCYTTTVAGIDVTIVYE